MRFAARGAIFEFPWRPLVMGIVNLGSDSFSGDGCSTIEEALARAKRQLVEGADIIDVGAESARTNRAAISEAEEIARLLRFIEQWPRMLDARSSATSPPLLSINTWRPGVVRAVLPSGGDVLNDIGGLATAENAQACAESGAALVIMHTVGEPKVPHTHVAYDDVMTRMTEFFRAKIEMTEAAGLQREAILLDPGIDFAKQRDDNLRVLRELATLRQFGCAILLAASRKTVIGDVLNLPEPYSRDAGTIACVIQGMQCGASVFRVHNVRAAVQAIRTVEKVITPDFLAPAPPQRKEPDALTSGS